MTATAPPIDAGIARAQVVRFHAFFALLLITALATGMYELAKSAHATEELIAVKVAAIVFSYLWFVPYLTWIVADTRARGIRGIWRVVLALLSLLPVFGLLVYLVLTRKLTGILMWCGFTLAVIVCYGLSTGAALVARSAFAM